jgi:hypothetical protein
MRRLVPMLIAAMAAGGWLVAPAGVRDVRAATPDLTIVGAARYDVQPDHRRVRVTVDLSLVNHLRDTRTKRFFFDHASLTVLPGASHPTLSWSGPGDPKAHITRSTRKATTIRLDLARRLYSGKSATYRLVFDIVDRGGPSTRNVRIGGSLVRFPVWAYASADTPGSTVRVVFPAGFEATVAAGKLDGPTTDASGRQVFETGKLKAPLTFFAYLVADRPGSTTTTSVATTVAGRPVDLSIEAWADDAAWSKRVGKLVRRALPLLSERIGLPWLRDDGLLFRESLGRSSGGFTGLYDPAAGTVDVAFDAADGVVLHEAAHAWFDGALLADRWADEGFASYYAQDVAPSLNVGTTPTGDQPPAAVAAAVIPLNAWGPAGETDRATDDYAYAASLILARAIAERAGPDALRAVWADASDRRGAYQPIVPAGVTPTVSIEPEMVDGAPDWRGLLDLLEDRSGQSFEDLWRRWVARDTDLALLDQRSAARERYTALLSDARGWVLPRSIRDALRAWRFDEATSLMLDARAILDQRGEIERRATAAGSTVPGTVRESFERPGGFGDAIRMARDESTALDRLEAALAARPAELGPIETLGLWGTSPDDDLARSRSRLAAGDLTGSAEAAAAAATAWASAAEVGRTRLLSLGILTIAGLLGVALLASWLRGRRRPKTARLPTFDLDG